MSSIEFDDSRFPIVRVTFVGVVTSEEFERYLDSMTKLLLRRQMNVMVLDASRAGLSPPIQRRRQAEWMKEHDAELRRYSKGTAFVITSTLVRGALTAILWLQPMPTPHVVVSTIEEAETWARSKLRDAGVEIRPA